MEKEFDLLSMGEVLLRLSPPEHERLVQSRVFEKQIGGAELNVAAGAALLGLRTGIVSRIPSNSIGEFARNRILACGVRDDYLLSDRSADARLGIYYYENGAYPRSPGIVYDRGHSSIAGINIREFGERIYGSARCFHTSGITLALGGTCRDTVIQMIKRFKEAGTCISFDVNFRLNLWSGKEARACIEQILPYVDIFFCSEDTARLTFGKSGNVREIMRSFAKEYPVSVVASTQRTVHSPKVHSFTSVIYDAKEDTYYEEKPYENIEVVDRIGSGDAYVSGVLYGLLCEGGCPEIALEYGNACSAAKNTITGDMQAMNLDELNDIIQDRKTTGYHSEMKR